MRARYLLAGCGGVLAALVGTSALAATSCEDLANLKMPNVTITAATPVSALASVAANLATAQLAAPFCRVVGFATPTKDSHIGFEVWLPGPERWNGKFQATGNGGFLGQINYRSVLPGLNRNYATLTSDLGHVNKGGAEDATWALGHPEKVIDYAYRGQHESVTAAKQIVATYYGGAPKHSYFTGCSAGGISGLTELLRYPTDFDGYVIGDAVADHLGQEMGALWNTLEASLKNPAEAIRPAQIPLIHKAVLAQCAGKDGGLASDPFLTDPRACKFDFKPLQCRPGQAPDTCLTTAQIAIVTKVFKGPVDPRTGYQILSGINPGAELTWDRYFTGKKNPATADRPWGGFLMYMAYQDPEYLSSQKYQGFDFDKDYQALMKREVAGEPLDSSWNTRNRNLEAFRAAGGKIIQYHGWDDPNIPALEAIRFQTSLKDDLAKRQKLSADKAQVATDAFHRLFMVPGMGHCTGGDGPWSFGQNTANKIDADPETDTLAALERWVEKGTAPEKFLGSRIDAKTNKADLTRPICVYPKIAAYKGSGDVNEAANFACVVPKPQRQAKK